MAFVISRTSPIGELVLNHPVSASVLLEHGFHCIGCGLAAYETLEEGASAHGFDEAAIDALVQEIKDAAAHEEEILLRSAEKSEAAAKSQGTTKSESAEKSKYAEKKSASATKTPADAAKAAAAVNDEKNKKAEKKSKPG